MAAGKRRPNESLEEYRKRLKNEDWATKVILGGRFKRKKIPLKRKI